MTTWNDWEAGLAGLKIHDADPARVEQIRARCRAAFAAQQRSRLSGRARLTAIRRWLEPAIAFGLSALYLAAAVGSSVALLR
jgi:hypothetical protein